MEAASYYRDVQEQVCQGDIFSDVPHLFLKERSGATAKAAPAPSALPRGNALPVGSAEPVAIGDERGEQIAQLQAEISALHALLQTGEIKFNGTKVGSFTDSLSGPTFPSQGSDIIVPCPCRVERAILLTHGCQIDKDRDHRVVALVRTMTPLIESEKEPIRGGG